MKNASAAAWLPLLALCLLSEAYADGAEGIALEEVTVTATRREARGQDVAAAVSGVTGDDILGAMPDVIAAALRHQPGAFFQQTTPGQGVPIVRGLKGSQVLHLVDGMRLNNAFFRSAPNQYLGLVDAYLLDRVELLRGAAGALYGADAMGGVVQVLTRDARTSEGGFNASGRLYAAYTSFDHGRVLRADTDIRAERAGFTGGVTLQNHADRRTPSGTVRPSAYRSKAVDAKVLFKPSNTSDIMMSAQVLEQPSTPRSDELVPGYGQEHPSSEVYRFQPNRRTFLHGRYRWSAEAGILSALELHLARQVIDDDRVTQDFGSPVVDTEQNRSTLDGFTLQGVSTVDTKLVLTWGLELYRDRIESARQRSIAQSADSEAVRSRFPDGSRMDSNALYLVADWHPSLNWSLTSGLRYSAFDIRLPATPDAPPASLSPNDVSGDLRLVRALTADTNLVVNIGRGFRPPNIFDLGTLGPRPGNRFNVANTDLDPETVWSYDLGLKTTGEGWSSEAFLFYLDYRDRITTVDTGQVTANGRTVVRSENVSTVRLYGVEARLNWRFSERVTLAAHINYTWGEDRETGGKSHPADRIPPLNGHLALEWVAGERFTVRPYLAFAARQDRLSPRDVGDPRIDPAGTDGWGTVNLDLAWRLRPSIDLGVRLENLGDVSYREHGSGIDAPGRSLGVWLNAGF